MNTFKKYSQFYDTLYESKDYTVEVEFIDQVIKKYSKINGRKILSLGCGTCSHDILLAKKGYEIIGVDQSSAILEIAKNKIIKEKVDDKITLVESDIRKMKIGREHDVAMAMFNVMGYQTNNEDIDNTLQSVSKGLKQGGLFFFDCWYMPAVLSDKPTDRIREIYEGDIKTIRLTQSKLNLEKNIIDINFHVLKINKNRIVNEADENHSMRFWSLPEIEYFLDSNGFDLIRACNFMDLNSNPSEKEWNMFIITRKR